MGERTGNGTRGLSYQALPCRLAREGRRLWRGMLRRWRSHGIRFVFHDAYRRTLPSGPLDPERADRILAFLAEEGLVQGEDLARPRPPSLRHLLRVHDLAYLESLQRTEVGHRIFGVPVSDDDLEGVVETQRLMVGGTMYATRLAIANRTVAFNLGGGLHHAYRGSGMGFCLFNDIAVAIARIRAGGFREPVLVVDLDLHDGNGTRAIFARDPSVHTYSVHNEHWGDTTAEGSTSIALGGHVTDEQYLGTLLKTLPDVVDEVQPGLVVYLAGTDPAADDALGNWEISPEGILQRDRFVIEQVRRSRRIPVVVVLGGGYGVDTWKHTARFATWMLTGRAAEPPDTEELTLLRFRRISRKLDRAALTAEPGGEFSWRLEDSDLAGILPGVPRRTRFLSYFSRHGVELLLERFGILDKLRVSGFRHPQVEVDLGHPLGQTVRVWGDPDRTELLVELRVARSTRVVPEHAVVVLEWLLLQNPRAHFGPYRRPLPGQKHPGLGMLKEILGWLVMVCEILELDGIYYAPSSFHVAAQSRRIVRFLHPEHEARFRAFEGAVEGLSLGEASRAVAEDRIVDRRSGEPVSWRGYPMVLPVAGRMRERLFSDEYEREVVEALGELDLVLAEGVARGEPQPVG